MNLQSGTVASPNASPYLVTPPAKGVLTGRAKLIAGSREEFEIMEVTRVGYMIRINGTLKSLRRDAVCITEGEERVLDLEHMLQRELAKQAALRS